MTLSQRLTRVLPLSLRLNPVLPFLLQPDLSALGAWANVESAFWANLGLFGQNTFWLAFWAKPLKLLIGRMIRASADACIP